MRRKADDEVVFKPRRRQWAALVVLVLVLASNVVPMMFGGPYTWRPAGFAVVAFGLVAVVLFSRANRTVVTGGGIRCLQLGRPWLLWRKVTVPWHDIRAIEGRRFYANAYPALHLNDGGVIWARSPSQAGNPRFADEIALLKRRHLAATGLSPERAAAPERPPGPSRRRQFLLTGACAVVVALAIALTVRAFATIGDAPPEVAACPLLSAQDVEKAVPGARTREAPSPATCIWKLDDPGSGVQGPRLTLSVNGYGDDYGREKFEEERLENRVQHLTHDIPGLTGHSWSALAADGANAGVLVREGRYHVTVELRDGRASGPDRERRAAEVARTAGAAMKDRT